MTPRPLRGRRCGRWGAFEGPAGATRCLWRVARPTAVDGDTTTEKLFARCLENGLGGERIFEPPRLMHGINQGEHFF
jgi:hypothetical protein